VYNYNAICAMAALCGFGLGGQIPIDATITLEFLPQNKRYLLALLSLWQPIGVVVACAIAYGFVPKYRCDTELPSCMITAAGEACCSKGSNMGWRYLMITLGAITLFVFFLRFIVFNFRESPKFLLGKGREEEAIAVLHSIARFNRAPPPTLTMEDFALIDQETSLVSDPVSTTPLKTHQHAKLVLRDALGKLRHLKGLFRTRLMGFTTIVIWIAYMGDFWSEYLLTSTAAAHA
jgi:MFS family permease